MMYQLGLARQRDAVGLLREEVRHRRGLCRPYDFLLRLGQVAGEVDDPIPRSQIRPSATSMCENTCVTGNFCCWLCEVSLSSGASAQI